MKTCKGITTDLIGSVEINSDNPSNSIGNFRVDMRTFETGIDIRDEHMRNRHLHTKKYPYAYFELVSIQGFDPEGKRDVEQACQGAGLFYIHGVRKQITPNLKVTKIPYTPDLLVLKLEQPLIYC